MSDQELNNKTPELLYHYCSVETFFQIIKNQTLRLTNIQYMNDSEELHYGLDLLEKPDEELLLDKAYRDDIRIYAMCFCEEGDLLSQWRGYGDNAEGLSIGFDFSILKDEKDLRIPKYDKPNPYYSHSLQKIIYDFEEQEKKVSEFLNIDKTDLSFFIEQWHRLVASLKNPNFAEEKEWRFISSMSSLANGTNHKDENVSFCVTNKNIVPYIDRKFKDLFNVPKKENIDSEIQLYPITHIIIGSSCKLDAITIEKFLHQNMPYSDIVIEKSNLSYKTK